MKQPPETIYLIPGEDIDGQLGWLWCDDPAPSHDHDPDEAVKYVRAGAASAIERDTAFRQRDLAYKQRDEMELKWSKARREARNLRERTEELETMIKVFRGCIETGLFPKPGSPCQMKIFELVGERE